MLKCGMIENIEKLMKNTITKCKNLTRRYRNQMSQCEVFYGQVEQLIRTEQTRTSSENTSAEFDLDNTFTLSREEWFVKV